MALGINLEKAISHGVELAAVEIINRIDKYTPVATGSLRRSTKYRMKGVRAEIVSGEGMNTIPRGKGGQFPISDYAEIQYYGNTAGKSGSGRKVRHIGDFSTGLREIVAQYAGSLTTDDGYWARYSAAWQLADDNGGLKWLGAPRWIERAFWENRKVIQKIFASAFKPGAYR